MRKDTLLAFRVDTTEKILFQEAAKAEEMPLSFWVRKTLKMAARRKAMKGTVNATTISTAVMEN